MRLLLTIVVLLCASLISCVDDTPREMSKDDLVGYIQKEKNGLVKKQEVNGITVSVSYFPWQMLVAQELDGQNKSDSAIIKKLEKNYSGQYYFKAKFSKDGQEAIRRLGSFDRYSEMVQVLAFRMNDYINLTTPKRDTIEMADYFFDQTYGMSDGNTLLLSFSKDKITGNKTIDINIGECGFGTGALKFTFERDAIEATPKLVYTVI